MKKRTSPEELNLARVKLLTLLNLLESKPNQARRKKTGEEEEDLITHTSLPTRDWISIASEKQCTSSEKSTADDGENEKKRKVSEEEDDKGLPERIEIEKEEEHQPTSEQENAQTRSTTTDSYQQHFGAQPQCMDPKIIAQIESDQNNDQHWTLVKDSHQQKQYQSVRFKPSSDSDNDRASSSSSTTTILPILQNPIKKLDPDQNRFLESMRDYEDVWHADLPYDEDRHRSRSVTSLWITQHILKTRRNISKTNEYLAKVSKRSEDPGKSSTPFPERDIRDQGFTRPKVLILVPFRSSAQNWLDSIISNLQPDFQIKSLERFRTEYNLPKGTIDRLEEPESEERYPIEHRMIFKGNIDDDFKLPIQFNSKSIKLYCDFYSSDLIIGSPVGLRKYIEHEGNCDIFSSIEMLVVDQMDVMLMQNWDHVEFVIEHLNQIPKKTRDTDFSRIKPWYLDSQSKFIRQTILFSSLITPELNSLFRNLKNLRGKKIIRDGLKEEEEEKEKQIKKKKKDNKMMKRVKKGIEQNWIKFEIERDEDEDRIEFFKKEIYSKFFESSSLIKSGLGGILIFVSSYFEFVRLENFFKCLEDVKYAAISEYSTNREITAARSAFSNQHISYLLITERFHYYHRYHIKGIKTILFYSLPIHSDFFFEFINDYPFETNFNMNEKNKKNKNSRRKLEVDEVKVLVLVCKLDVLKVNRLVCFNDLNRILNDSSSSSIRFV